MGYNGFKHNPAEYAAAVECPTLLMAGARDLWVRPAETQAIEQQLRGPKQLVVVPDVGHDMPFVYWAPELWRQSVAELLAQVRLDATPDTSGYVTTVVLNLRVGPGTDQPIIAVLGADTPVLPTGQTQTVAGDVWVKVRAGDQIGWVSRALLRAP